MSEARPRRRVHEVAPEEPPESAPAQAPAAHEDVARVERFLRKLAEKHFFGKVTVSFQSGRVTDIRTEQVMKLDDL